VEILGVILFQRAQKLLKDGQVLRTQGYVCASAIDAAKCVRVGNIDGEKRNLPCAHCPCQLDEPRELSVVGALQSYAHAEQSACAGCRPYSRADDLEGVQTIRD
jgi:hypothetical protein